MVTAIYSLANVQGAEIWLVFWLVCALLYLAVCRFFRPNRTRQGRKTVWIGLLIAECLIDVIWAVLYYPNGSYLNYGIGAVYGLLVWIPILGITGVLVTAKNGN